MITKTWMMLAIGLGLSATVAEASPFIINTASSSGGRSRRGGGGGGGGFGGGGSMSSRSMRAPGQIPAPPIGGARGAGIEGVSPLQSQGPAPNTSPFGVSNADISAIVSTAGVGGTSLTSASLPTAFTKPGQQPGGLASTTPSPVAFLDLGNEQFLAVTPPVAGALVGQTAPLITPNHPAGVSESNTGDVGNQNGSNGAGGNSAGNNAGGNNSGPLDDTGTVGNVLPVVGTGLVTYPTDVLTGLTAASGLDSAAIANPEPASLVLLGTGLAVAARRAFRRKRA